MSFSIHLEPLIALFLGVFGLAVILQLLFYIRYYHYVVSKNRLLVASSAADEPCFEERSLFAPVKPVSVIVYSHNEADYLEQLLAKLFAQKYDCFEVVVVDDGSTDDTRNLVEMLQNTHPNLKACSVPVESRSPNPKKLALLVAMKAAKYDIFLHTEANCMPTSDQWIARMVAPISSSVDIVVGGYSYTPVRSFAYCYIALDHLIFSLRYLSRALRGRVYMGVGRNLCYKRSMLTGSNAFASHLNIATGDDDLFVHEIATPQNSVAVIDPDAVVLAHYYRVAKAWAFVKRNYYLSTSYFKRCSHFFFALETVSRYLFWGLLVAIGVLEGRNPIVLVTLLFFTIARLVVQMVVLRKAARMFSVKLSYLTIPLFELIQPIVDLFFLVAQRLTRRRSSRL